MYNLLFYLKIKYKITYMCIIIIKYDIESDRKNKHNIKIFIIFILFPNLHFILPKNEHDT